MNISSDKLKLLNSVVPSNAYIVTGEAGTGKTFAGGLCGAKLLRDKPKWQKVIYLTYSKFAKWQIIETMTKLVAEGLIDKDSALRMDIQNYHSLWWDVLHRHRAFLGINMTPQMCLQSELEKNTNTILAGLSKEDRSALIPDFFLREDGNFNQTRKKKLFDICKGLGLLYSQWGCDRFGKDGVIYTEKRAAFVSWAAEAIQERNKAGYFSHDETVWWAKRLFEKHPNAIALMKAIYPVLIIDEFQDIDISQWETVKFIVPETVIVLGDIKQTIHRWRGANPEARFQDFRSFCQDRKVALLEFPLTERNRATKDMSHESNITKVMLKPDNYDSQTKSKLLLHCKSETLKTVEIGTVGILCVSNSLANDVCFRFRITQNGVSENGRKWSLPKLLCVRLGAENSPFDTVREIIIRLLAFECIGNEHLKYIANKLTQILMGLPENKLPNCSSASRKDELKKRWFAAVAMAEILRMDFGQFLLQTANFIYRLEESCECYSERQMLRCITHVGTGIVKVGRHSWNKMTMVAKREKIDGLLLQYENLCAGRMKANIFIMTVHQAKGREFDSVIIPWFTPTKWNPVDSHSWDMTQPNIKELFHTACTRAKKKVIVIGLNNKPSLHNNLNFV